jgi:ElaB/YqjD/DUF883 family membrane-anchored ribosome-binding protein
VNSIHTDTPSSPTSMSRDSTLDRAADKITDAGERASEVARQGAQKLSDGTQQVKVRLNEVTGSAISYVRDEPVRAMLIAAGIGAGLMALAGMLGRSRH